MIGCILGMALTFPAAEAFSRTVGSYFPIFTIEPSTLYLDVAAALVVALVAAIIPARRAIRIRIAEGLRRIG